MELDPRASRGDASDVAVARGAWRLALLERDVLALLAEHRSVTQALDALATGLERIATPGTRASILLVDRAGRLHNGAAPSLPAAYTATIEGEPIGEQQGSCGTAAFRRATVIVEDIASDPLWARYRDVALAHGLKACWSVPIISTRDEVLGTFAFYYEEARAPTAEDMASIDGAAHIARIVLEHARAERERSRAARREKALFAAARVLAAAVDVSDAMRAVIEAVGTALEWEVAVAWLFDPQAKHLACVAHWSKPDSRLNEFVKESCDRTFAPGEGLPGRVYATGEPELLSLHTDDRAFPRRRSGLGARLRHGLALPIISGSQVGGVIELFTGSDAAIDPDLVPALRTLGLQVGQFLGRARAQSEQTRLVEELRETVRFSELLSGMLAHDLRNPLNTIVMGTELLLAMAGDDDTRERSTLARMKSSEQRMARMITQLLDLTRSRSGSGLGISRTSMDLAELTRSVVSELALAFPQRPVEVITHGDTSGSWDPDRLAQVVSNLVGNAVQHGAGECNVEVTIDGRASERIVLETRNAGTIPADLLPSVFDPFRRAGSTTSPGGAGLGLGLYITKLIATAHGGSVDVTSQEGVTTFRVVLPR